MDFYLAQVAAEIRRGNVKTPSRVHLDQFLIDFRTPASPQAQSKVAHSKKAWLSALGVKPC